MLVPEIDEKISFSGFVIRIRITRKDLAPEYLCYYMKSATATAHLRAGGGGANISNLNQGILSRLPILVPNNESQNLFVTSMRRLNAQVDILKHAAQTKLTDLVDLRQPLLQQAFSGQL